MFRYKSHRLTDDGPLRRRLEELAADRRRFGYRRPHVMLRREGWVVNIKRVRRVYREANLQVRKRLRRRVALGRGNPAPIVTVMNERWSLDFVHDTLASGRRIRALTIVDDYTHESLAIEVDTSLSGERVTRVLTMLGEIRGAQDDRPRQRHRADQPCNVTLGRRSSGTASSYCAGQANAERFHRELQRQVPRRMPQ
jgi:putative transposase